MEDNNALSWFSPDWFRIDTFMSYEWEMVYFLYLIPGVPLIFVLRWLVYFRFRQKFDIAFQSDLSRTSWHIQLARTIPHFVFIIFTILVLIALARPQRSDESREHFSEGIDILLVLDISNSMLLEDFKPNRLEVSKEVALNFISGRKNDRIGIVVFSGKAYTLSPLTTDYELLKSFIKNIQSDLIDNSGTAIGDAIGTGINRMRESTALSKVMILISDGENTEGNLDPVIAAELAQAFNIKIYTIGLGSEGTFPFGKDSLGNVRYVKSYLDEQTLISIADKGKGKYYKAANKVALSEIFYKINRLEKAPIQELLFKDKTDFYQIYLTWAIVFLLIWLFMKNTFLNNFLED